MTLRRRSDTARHLAEGTEKIVLQLFSFQKKGNISSKGADTVRQSGNCLELSFGSKVCWGSSFTSHRAGPTWFNTSSIPPAKSGWSIRKPVTSKACATFNMSGNETPLRDPSPMKLPKNVLWVVRIERYPSLFKTKILIGNRWCATVCNSWRFSLRLPSPARQTTLRASPATAAPLARAGQGP